MDSITDILEFQFHKGTIKTRIQISLLSSAANFNSIKVRLKPTPSTFKTGRQAFQFHKGTIKTFCAVCALYDSINFNSIKVRLKHTYI